MRHGIAEIEGFADSHLREFSSRRAEILKAAGGPEASARAREVATLATRSAKEHSLEGDMHERWRERAQEIGLSREAIQEAFDPRHARYVQEGERAVARSMPVGRNVTANASHFDRREVVQAVAGMRRDGMAAADVERVADEFLASDRVLRIASGPKGDRFTTKRVWEMEQRALDAAQRMRSEGARNAGGMIAERVLCAHPTLKADQREMVRRLLADREGVCVVIGEAGTGKSYAVLAAARGWSEAGMKLRVAAPTWRAANVLRAEGLRATTVASLLGELERAELANSQALARGSVLLVDEAGMVGSADIARLIHHAEEAEAKLVLIGDPEQLGEIEAGGMFRALAERCEPVRLDEVIRHESDVEREGARLIREGHGSEALDLYREQERVVVAADAEARREAMLAEWHRSFSAGEDAVMVAKQNVEVERLNAMARELRREAGQLGEQEIEVGEARFAAGDQVITRVNDHAAEVANRERWQVAEVDPERGRVVLEGIDQARTVEVGAEYLAKTNPHSDAPALQHAYAVTTYSAQGSTVDRAFVAADPSMDKQELYVATSRSRGETTIYATPEIQAAREEIAPGDPYLRKGIPHIAEASERDRAQFAAHDEAKRGELRELPTEELVSRRRGLSARAGKEESNQEQRRHVEHRMERNGKLLDHAIDKREAAEAAPRKVRREALPEARVIESFHRENYLQAREELRELPPVSHDARAELSRTELVLAERRQAAITAAILSPPAYVTCELGERPSDPERRASWDKGVSEIEGYRQSHGVKDPEHALGHEHDASRELARQRLQQRQMELQRVQARDTGREAGHSMEIGLDPDRPPIVAPLRRRSTPCGGRAHSALDRRLRGAFWRVGRGGPRLRRCANYAESVNSMPPSLRSLALADITPEDVDWMIREGETLVELKVEIPKDGIGPTVASFANTLGGWLILGVEDKDRAVVGWKPKGRADIVDYLRQCLLREVDPMPPFAARGMEVEGGQVGVVRIYESMDTPHIIRGTGAVHVREPGGKRPIREHAELIELARRGEGAEDRARARLWEMPVVAEVLQTPDTGKENEEPGAVRWVARAAPLTVSAPVRDWPLTRRASEWCTQHVNGMLRIPQPYGQERTRVEPYGRAITARVGREIGGDATDRALLVADSGGVFGAELARGIERGDRPSILLESILKEEIEPLAHTLAAMLAEAEAWGRAVVDLWCLFPGDERIFGPRRQPLDGRLHAAQELTIPAADAEVEAVAKAWHREFQRSMGVMKFEDENT